MRFSPITRYRFAKFRANRRGYWSFWIFAIMFVVSMLAEFIANDRPLLVKYDGDYYLPVFSSYPETMFGGDFDADANFTDPYLQDRIREKGWLVWPIIAYDYRTVAHDLSGPAPSAPDENHWLGTDDQSRDVLARALYGLRISVLFGFALTAVGSVIGIFLGALQGYFSGWVDLAGQRFLEIWGSVPTLYILIILASIVTPDFWWLLGINLLFSWGWPIGLVRTEFYKARNYDFVRAARALGVGEFTIMIRHILPNALSSTMAVAPFVLAGSVTILANLDFLGFGLPPGSPSLGEMVLQGRNNFQAPWLIFTAFGITGGILMLLVFIGEAVRDAFDPRKGLPTT